MPTYDFRCPQGHDFERFFGRISEAPSEVACPVCGEIATRQISGGAGLIFKGSGFYITDYGKDGKKDQRAASHSGGNSKHHDHKGGGNEGRGGEGRAGESPGGGGRAEGAGKPGDAGAPASATPASGASDSGTSGSGASGSGASGAGKSGGDGGSSAASKATAPSKPTVGE